jgi:hypothetical protein
MFFWYCQPFFCGFRIFSKNKKIPSKCNFIFLEIGQLGHLYIQNFTLTSDLKEHLRKTVQKKGNPKEKHFLVQLSLQCNFSEIFLYCRAKIDIKSHIYQLWGGKNLAFNRDLLDIFERKNMKSAMQSRQWGKRI